jgi:hypothetical protein
MPPTVVIVTGNGAHAWWLFKSKRQSNHIYAQACFGVEVESWSHRESSIAGGGRKQIG